MPVMMMLRKALCCTKFVECRPCLSSKLRLTSVARIRSSKVISCGVVRSFRRPFTAAGHLNPFDISVKGSSTIRHGERLHKMFEKILGDCDPKDVVKKFTSTSPAGKKDVKEIIEYLYADLRLRLPDLNIDNESQIEAVVKDPKVLSIVKDLVFSGDMVNDLNSHCMNNLLFYASFIQDPRMKVVLALEESVIQHWPSYSDVMKLRIGRRFYSLSKVHNQYFLCETLDNYFQSVVGRVERMIFDMQHHLYNLLGLCQLISMQIELKSLHGIPIPKELYASLLIEIGDSYNIFNFYKGTTILFDQKQKLLQIYLELVEYLDIAAQVPYAFSILCTSLCQAQEHFETSAENLQMVDKMLKVFSCSLSFTKQTAFARAVANVIINSLDKLDIKTKIRYAYYLSEMHFKSEALLRDIWLSFPTTIETFRENSFEALDCLHLLKCLLKIRDKDEASFLQITPLFLQEYLERFCISENWEESHGFLVVFLVYLLSAPVLGISVVKKVDVDTILEQFFSKYSLQKLEDGIQTNREYVKPLLQIYGYLELEGNTKYTAKIPLHHFEIPVIRDTVLGTHQLKLSALFQTLMEAARAISREVRFGTLPHFGLVFAEMILDAPGNLVRIEKVPACVVGDQQKRMKDGWQRIAIRVMSETDYVREDMTLNGYEECHNKVLEQLGFTVICVPSKIMWREESKVKEYLEERLVECGWRKV